MSEHFIVAVDHGQLRIYTEGNTLAPFPPRVQLVESIDLGPQDVPLPTRARRGPTRFPVPGATAERNGAGVGHGGRREDFRRQAQLITAKLQAFWGEHPMASWDLAAAPALYNALIETLSPDVGRRLKRVYSNAALGEVGGVGAVAAVSS
ncbi:host attachment protein [Opitutus terrae]|uniref:Host attachment protein n=1 Tax=Opitutus terrae (strain DSM 11246 / JCM 15787 / PB90-1) TaxID=452637 RepID=B1ZZY8_OPITP|nr:host attachment protein [Opitutus terrae]ACB77324.1 hypothetical protein Oter_4050 [Opitutus terrae PB90-1]